MRIEYLCLYFKRLDNDTVNIEMLKIKIINIKISRGVGSSSEACLYSCVVACINEGV